MLAVASDNVHFVNDNDFADRPLTRDNAFGDSVHVVNDNYLLVISLECALIKLISL